VVLPGGVPLMGGMPVGQLVPNVAGGKPHTKSACFQLLGPGSVVLPGGVPLMGGMPVGQLVPNAAGGTPHTKFAHFQLLGPGSVVLPAGVPMMGGMPVGQLVPNAAGGKPQAFATARLPQQQVSKHVVVTCRRSEIITGTGVLKRQNNEAMISLIRKNRYFFKNTTSQGKTKKF
jgi:hypothetical protein